MTDYRKKPYPETVAWLVRNLSYRDRARVRRRANVLRSGPITLRLVGK